MRAQAIARKIDLRNWIEEDALDSIAHDVRKGLAARQKYIPSKYFYDARGSELFEAICQLPEYYPTRTELGLLAAHAGDIVADFEGGDLVELGSGADWKIRALLDALGAQRRSEVRYVPVDVSDTAVTQSVRQLVAAYPELKVDAIVADFTRDLHRIRSDRPKLVLFFGSTIGNLDESECQSFLRAVSESLTPNDRLVLGLDMIKDVEILETAYNDSQRVTAEFNKNILLVLNREVGADFDPDDFEHHAFYNSDRQRVEMHLVSGRNLRVRIRRLNLTVDVAKGETIRTEICRKFNRSGTRVMLRKSGLEVTRWFSDPKGWFSIAEIVRAHS